MKKINVMLVACMLGIFAITGVASQSAQAFTESVAVVAQEAPANDGQQKPVVQEDEGCDC